MATLHFTVLKSRQTAKKSYFIYLALSHKGEVRYITTEYEIDDLYQFDKGKVVCRKDSKVMNQRLAYVGSEYQQRLESIPPRLATLFDFMPPLLHGIYCPIYRQ